MKTIIKTCSCAEVVSFQVGIASEAALLASRNYVYTLLICFAS